ncbi:hypothetical protein SCLCIDRAFT_111531 [Scleroderma citrinum Foug A]|uniref:Aspartic peptidase DDI1-type domain-containing protein n=1 Tax=Scleroderma citrinum Foug A TaxID=1036808 RepID=A0A0C3ECS9_9AGAM|nr:hypothetical protein SCLCIDRAFT_111531 [Scleroderma citrinum Foug A]
MSSSLSQNNNAKVIVDCILATPFTLSVGEVISSSKDISQKFQDLIRIKRQPIPQPIPFVRNVQGVPPSASFACLASCPLITVHFLCNGQLVKAIINSGSTLNVVRNSIAKTVIKMPMDTSHIMHMKDANGGTSKLLGLILHVPLFCGAAKTWAHVYISPDNNSDFDLLLGRPWAQGNTISIVEKDSGTYIVFGADPDQPLEMCVAEPHSGHSDFGTGLLATLEPGDDPAQQPSPPLEDIPLSTSVHSQTSPKPPILLPPCLQISCLFSLFKFLLLAVLLFHCHPLVCQLAFLCPLHLFLSH